MKKKTAGERIRDIRGEMSQADFGQLLDSSQGAVSAWERDDKDRSPSAAIYFRLAALAHDPDDSIFFLNQAGLRPDAVITVADVLLKKGEVKMNAILATAEQVLKQQLGDQQQRAKEGRDFIVPPYPGVERLSFDISVPALLVSNQATTFYLPVGTKDMFRQVGHNVEAGDILVFDSREVSSYEEIAGEKVVVEFEDGPYVGRLGYVAEGLTHHLVIGPSDVPPANWAFHVTPDLKVIHSHHAPGSRYEGQSRRERDEVQRYLGIWLAQFSTGAHDWWKKMAQQHKPRK
jgi:transcriptional regulator with XRE-family HTH domain